MAFNQNGFYSMNPFCPNCVKTLLTVQQESANKSKRIMIFTEMIVINTSGKTNSQYTKMVRLDLELQKKKCIHLEKELIEYVRR